MSVAMELMIPRGDSPLTKGQEPTGRLAFDITRIQQAESRLIEISAVTTHKAGELMATFNLAFLDTTRILSMARYQLVKAEQSLEQRRAIFIIDILPNRLREKGIATPRSPLGSEDIRTALVASDADYQCLSERRDRIKAIIELLEGKKRAFENAYSAVKKVIGENAYDHRRNADLSGGLDDQGLGSGDQMESKSAVPQAFGSARTRWGIPNS